MAVASEPGRRPTQGERSAATKPRRRLTQAERSAATKPRRRLTQAERSAATKPRRRLTQAERSAATRLRLLDATVDCLVELGWSGTSTTEVVRRAGVSRGAQVHHYPSKEDLVVAAVEHLTWRRMDAYRETFDSLPAAARTPAAAVELLWSIWSSPTEEAWLELAVASRTQPALRERFVEFERRFFDAAVALFHETQPEAAFDPAFARFALRFTFGVLDGMAVARLAGAETQEVQAVIEAFKVLTTLLPPPQAAVL